MTRTFLLYLVLWLAATAAPVAWSCPEEGKGAAPAPSGKASVHIITRRDGETIQFFVDNREWCEVTVNLELAVENLKSDKRIPLVGSFPARQFSLALVLRPEDPAKGWRYSYTNHYKLGNRDARHDDSQLYLLPYLPGYRFKVTQGYNGPYSHRGSNRYAIDWKMPEGTVVCAARDGEVVKLKQDSDSGGPSPKFDSYNNYILIRHDDGTLGHYCHLQLNGALVQIGQRVKAGQPIGLSGNTGYSSGPHLHFCVYRTVSGRQRESVPVRFRTAEAMAVTLVEDGRYRAAALPLPSQFVSDRVAGEPQAVEGRGGAGGPAGP